MPFDTQSAAQCASKAHAARRQNSGHSRQLTPLSQAVQLQRALHKVGIAVANDVSVVTDTELRARIGSSLASIAKGWDAMSARVLILRGKASPGTLSPSERKAIKDKKIQPKSIPRPVPVT